MPIQNWYKIRVINQPALYLGLKEQRMGHALFFFELKILDSKITIDQNR